MSELLRVWDAPLRLFHGLLAASVLGACLSAWLGGAWMEWHARLGLMVLGLLLFRLLWGVLGSSYARWSYLLMSILAAPRYLKGQWRGLGHNPLGALSVLAMLGALAVQVGSGLFADDDIALRGPLQALVSSAQSQWLTGLHRYNQWLVLGLIALHLAAIAWHRMKGKPLVAAMLHGHVRREYPGQRSAHGGHWAYALLAVLLAAGSVWAVDALPARWAPPPAASAPDLGW